MNRAITLDICRSCRGIGSIIGATGQCESCFKQEIYRNAFKMPAAPAAQSLVFRRRIREVIAGFALLGVVSLTAAQFFMVHNRYETASSFPYLVALGGSVLFLSGLSWKLLFFGMRGA